VKQKVKLTSHHAKQSLYFSTVLAEEGISEITGRIEKTLKAHLRKHGTMNLFIQFLPPSGQGCCKHPENFLGT
jgi:carbamoylphosphate synthase small subunit